MDTETINATDREMQFDADAEIDRFCALLGGREVFLTTLPPTGEKIVSNGSIAEAVRALDAKKQKGTYWAINPLIAGKTSRSGENIERRNFLYIDVDDPDHGTKFMFINKETGDEIYSVAPATAAGKQEALGVRDKILDLLLNNQQWPAPVLVDSGNGYAIFFKIELPNDDETGVLIAEFLDAVKERFGSAIDTSVGGAERLARVPGTMNRRGMAMKARPYRPCRFLAVPDSCEYLVDAEMILRATDAMRVATKPKQFNTAYLPGDDRAKAVDALNHVSPSRGVAYLDWLRVGMALHSVNSDLLAEWDSWSRSCGGNYEDDACAKKWVTFGRNANRQITIGSLIHWGKIDSPGWRPTQQPKVNSTSEPKPSPRTDQSGNGVPRDLTIVSVILSYLQKKFEPTFKRGDRIWSNAFSREIPRHEACGAPTSDLIDAMMKASDFPRGESGPRRSAAPSQFRSWAPWAWSDLLASLPDEPASSTFAQGACEQFETAVAGALLDIQGFAHTYRDSIEQRAEVERRSLIEWCKIWAKPGRWESIRSLSIWCKRGPAGELCVAVHQRLFGQIRRTGLPDTHRKFAQLCEAYGIGTSGGTSRSRFVALSQSFIIDLLSAPDDGECDGPCDGDSDGGSRMRENDRVESPSASHPPSHQEALNRYVKEPHKNHSSEGLGGDEPGTNRS